MLGYRTMEWDVGRATQGSEVEWGGEGEGKDEEEGINGRAEGWLCEGGEERCACIAAIERGKTTMSEQKR